MVAEYYIYC